MVTLIGNPNLEVDILHSRRDLTKAATDEATIVRAEMTNLDEHAAQLFKQMRYLTLNTTSHSNGILTLTLTLTLTLALTLTLSLPVGPR